MKLLAGAKFSQFHQCVYVLPISTSWVLQKTIEVYKSNPLPYFQLPWVL
jgi:hypothetical protein